MVIPTQTEQSIGNCVRAPMKLKRQALRHESQLKFQYDCLPNSLSSVKNCHPAPNRRPYCRSSPLTLTLRDALTTFPGPDISISDLGSTSLGRPTRLGPLSDRGNSTSIWCQRAETAATYNSQEGRDADPKKRESVPDDHFSISPLPVVPVPTSADKPARPISYEVSSNKFSRAALGVLFTLFPFPFLESWREKQAGRQGRVIDCVIVFFRLSLFRRL